MGLFDQIYGEVKKIPPGKVSTYGEIGKRVGLRDCRKVGWALHANREADVSCHRVVNKEGGLARTFAFGGAEEQRRRLTGEGVIFTREGRVDLGKCRWEE